MAVAKQMLRIKILSCGGLRDLMSEMEASFLVSALGLFRNVEGFANAKPRANVNLARAYTAADFYDSVFGTEDVLHLIGHANADRLEVGTSSSKVYASSLAGEAQSRGAAVPPVIVSTGCKVQSAAWRGGLKDAGAKVLIAAEGNVTAANLTAWDMAFYSALLSQVYKGKTLTERVEASFALADDHYRAVHADGATFAKFRLSKL